MNMPLRKGHSNKVVTIDPAQLDPIVRDRFREISDWQGNVSRRSQAMLAAAGMDRPDRRWFVIEVESGSDRSVAERLLFGGVEVWIPTVTAKARRRSGCSGPRPVASHLVIPGYVFAKVEATEIAWSALSATKGVSRLVDGASGRPVAVPDDKVALFKAYIAKDKSAIAIITNALCEGDRGRVKTGPMMGAEGRAIVVDEDRGFAVLEIILFGRMTRTHADIANIMKL